MNTRITEESGYIGILALLARLIDRELVGKVFIPTRQLEKLIGIDAFLKSSEEIYLIQLKVKESEEDNLDDRYITWHYHNQLNNIIKLKKEIEAENKNIKKILILGGLGGLGGEGNNRWLKLYLGEYKLCTDNNLCKDGNNIPEIKSWYIKGLSKLKIEDHEEYKKIIAEKQEDVDPLVKGKWGIGELIYKIWSYSHTENNVIIMSDKGIFVINDINKFMKDNILRKDIKIKNEKRIMIGKRILLNSALAIIFVISIFGLLRLIGESLRVEFLTTIITIINSIMIIFR